MSLFTWTLWDELADDARRAALARPSAARGAEVESAVRSILDDVSSRRDAALYDLTARFDRVQLDELEVVPEWVAASPNAIDSRDLAAIERAATNIERFHRPQRGPAVEVETEPGVFCRRLTRPLDSVGLYVPGGTAPLVSTLLMLAVPARIAGCGERIVCTPPTPDGSVNPHVLAAAALSGVTSVYRVGGAQAIAAMAFGTETVPQVDKIFGPGNSYVAAAKQIVSAVPGGPAIDLPAGPSELLVVADETADASFVASDLLSQAEHDETSQVVLVSPSRPFATRVHAELRRQLALLPRRTIAESALAGARTVLVRDLDQAIDVSNFYAPEHLILNCGGAGELVERVRHAGSVFIGPWSPEAMGDYATGTNHVLPTYGSARAYGGLTVESFCKTMTVQRLTDDGLRRLAPTVERLAALEGLDGHALAVRLRRLALDRVLTSE